jgi:hypothetical protein
VLAQKVHFHAVKMNSKGLHRNDELPFEPGSSSSSSSSSSDEEPVDQETQQQRRLEPLQLLFITLSALQGYIGEGLVINDLQGRPRGTEQDYLFPAYGHLLAHSKDYHDHSTLESPDTTAALMQYRSTYRTKKRRCFRTNECIRIHRGRNREARAMPC